MRAAYRLALRSAPAAASEARLNALAQRVVGSESAHEALRDDARAVLSGIVGQAREEFARQNNSLLVLRADTQAEVASTRAFLSETR